MNEEIDRLVREFFTAFHSAEAKKGSLDRLPSIFAPGAIISVLAGGELRGYTVPEFVQPRRALLVSGAVADFTEWETESETLLGQDVACRKSRYAKKGVRDGVPFTGAGTKAITFVRLRGAWKILSILWEDDS